jgi:hypothetical protein
MHVFDHNSLLTIHFMPTLKPNKPNTMSTYPIATADATTAPAASNTTVSDVSIPSKTPSPPSSAINDALARVNTTANPETSLATSTPSETILTNATSSACTEEPFIDLMDSDSEDDGPVTKKKKTSPTLEAEGSVQDVYQKMVSILIHLAGGGRTLTNFLCWLGYHENCLQFLLHLLLLSVSGVVFLLY